MLLSGSRPQLPPDEESQVLLANTRGGGRVWEAVRGAWLLRPSSWEALPHVDHQLCASSATKNKSRGKLHLWASPTPAAHPRPEFRWRMSQGGPPAPSPIQFPFPSSLCLPRTPSRSRAPLPGPLPYPTCAPVHTRVRTHRGCFCREKNASVLGLANCLYPLLLGASQPGIPQEGPWPEEGRRNVPTPLLWPSLPFPEFKKTEVSERYASLSKPCGGGAGGPRGQREVGGSILKDSQARMR